MATRTWLGILNNDANNPNNWTPSGPLKADDTLVINNGGTVDISGKALSDNLFEVAPSTTGLDPTLNLRNTSVNIETINQPWLFNEVEGSHFILHASGHDTLNGDISDATVKLDDHSKLLFTGRMTFLNIDGSSNSEFINDGTVTMVAGTGNATINTDLGGTGSINIIQQEFQTLTFGGKVGQGQTVNVNGNDNLIIDKPESFLGLVNLHPHSPTGFGVSLLGVIATSYDYFNDILRLYNGDNVVDTLRLYAAGASTLRIEQETNGVRIAFGQGEYIPPHLPIHI